MGNMGGSGSGRYSWFRATTTNQMLDIKLSWMKKKGLLEPGTSGSLNWSQGGEQIGAIQYRCECDGLRLIYRSRPYSGDWQEVNELIPFTYTNTNFGGQRRWFKCPSCSRSCSVLYGGAYFRCRKCYNLKYETQYERPWDRAITRALKIRERLGDKGGIDDMFPEKPKGMHWKTYRKLKAEYDKGHDAWARICMNWMDRFNVR